MTRSHCPPLRCCPCDATSRPSSARSSSRPEAGIYHSITLLALATRKERYCQTSCGSTSSRSKMYMISPPSLKTSRRSDDTGALACGQSEQPTHDGYLWPNQLQRRLTEAVLSAWRSECFRYEVALRRSASTRICCRQHRLFEQSSRLCLSGCGAELDDVRRG